MTSEFTWNLTACSREEWEKNLTDAMRFMKPADYTTDESLKYFRTEENRNLFVEWFHKQELSNKNFKAIADVSFPYDPVRKAHKPVYLVWELHREKFMHDCKTKYNLNEQVLKEIYHECFTEVAQLKVNPDDNSLENLFQLTVDEKLQL